MNATPIYDELVGTRVLDSLDFTPVCESKVGCERTATTLVVHACCGFSYLYCDWHLRCLDLFVRSHLEVGVPLTCNHCKVTPAPPPRLIPLDGAS